MRRNRTLVGAFTLAVLAAGIVASCTNSSARAPVDTASIDDNPGAAFGGATKSTARAAAADEEGTDGEVTFDSGGLTIHASLRRPTATTSAAVPAVVLVAGSGPTDRNGDSKAIAGSVGTLSWLADRFAAEGVASLRYDKLGTGATGAGDAAAHPDDVGFDVFVNEARDALSYLARQPGIDPTKLVIGGHSEGGLIALVVASDPGRAPAPVGVAMFSPPGQRYLDLISTQVKAQTSAAVAKGAMSPSAQASFDGVVDRAVAAVRSGSPLPADLPQPVTSIFNPTTTKFLQEADRVDPKSVAAALGASHRMLITCGENDIQVACADVSALQASFPATAVTFVSLPHTDHVMKDVGSGVSDGNEYGSDLPFTKDLAAPLHTFVSGL